MEVKFISIFSNLSTAALQARVASKTERIYQKVRLRHKHNSHFYIHGWTIILSLSISTLSIGHCNHRYASSKIGTAKCNISEQQSIYINNAQVNLYHRSNDSSLGYPKVERAIASSTNLIARKDPSNIDILSDADIPHNPPKTIITIGSWNLENFGKSKSDETIAFIANEVNDLDIVSIQEVVAGYGGAQAVARLADALNRRGVKWDYRVSDPTSGENSYKRERYAFLWKTHKVSLIGRPWLERKFSLEINREPFFATFNFNGKRFTLVTFHAITKKMQPETEIKYFKFLPAEYPDDNLLFCGDFNCPQTHTVFNPLKHMGYEPVLVDQKTTLKERPVDGIYLASEFDNMFYNTSRIHYIHSGIIAFFNAFPTLEIARKVSDHVPIWFQFSLN